MALPFADRTDAGLELATRLDLRFHDRLHEEEGCVIVALSRGGIPVGAAIARTLGLPLDLLVVRKLGVPWQPELAFGALASGGFRHLNHDMVTLCGLEATVIDEVIARESAELQRREQRYRAHLGRHDWAGRRIVLVDDGLATGATMQVAVQAVEARGPSDLIIAVPVGAADAIARLQAEGRTVLSLHVPEPFGSVGQWYARFPQVSDEDVIACLEAMPSSVSASSPCVEPRSPGHP